MCYNKHLPFTVFGTEGLDFPVLHDASAYRWEQQFALTPFHITGTRSFWITVSSDSCDPEAGSELPHSCSPTSSEITRREARATSSKEIHRAKCWKLQKSDVSIHFTENTPVGTHLSNYTFRKTDCLLYKSARLLLLSKSQSIFCRPKYSLPFHLMSLQVCKLHMWAIICPGQQAAELQQTLRLKHIWHPLGNV